MNRNRFLFWGLLLALVVRLAYLYLTVGSLHIPVPQSGDNYHYYQMGLEVREQGLLFKDTTLYPEGKELNFTAPLMGWYLGIIFMLFGTSWLAVIAFNLLFSVLLVYVIYKISTVLSSNIKYGNLALLISAFYFPFLYFLNSAGKEVLTAFLFMLTVYFIVLIEKTDKEFLTAILAALSFSLLSHLDERYIFYLPLFVIFIYLIAGQSQDRRWLVLSYVLVFIVFTGLFFAPWVYRNRAIYKKPVLLSLRMSPYTDKLLKIESEPKEGMQNLSERGEEYQYLSPEQLDSITVQNAEVHRKTPVSAEEYRFIRNVRKPFRYTILQQYLSHAKDLWRITNFRGDYIGTGYRFDQWSPKRNLMSILAFGIILLTAILSCVGLIRVNKTVFVFFVCILVLHTIIHVFIIGSGLTRYRYPVDGLLIITASMGLGYAFLSKPEKSRR